MKPNKNLELDGITFDLEAGGDILSGCYWLPNGPPRFIYLYIHSMNSFMLFNREINDIILSYAGVVFSVDHYGHGTSPGPRSHCTCDKIIDEILVLIQYSLKLYPNLPVYIHGHSIGALCLLSAAYQYPTFFENNVHGIILESPFITENPRNGISFFKSTMIALLNLIYPEFLISYDGANSYNMDTTYIDIYSHSSYGIQLASGKISAAFFNSIYKEMIFVRRESEKYPNSVPIAILVGQNDQLLNEKEIDDWINDFYLKNNSASIEYFYYETGCHFLTKSYIIFHDVVQDILTFIDSLIDK